MTDRTRYLEHTETVSLQLCLPGMYSFACQVIQLCTGVTLVYSSLQEVLIQQFIYGQFPNQVETVEAV